MMKIRAYLLVLTSFLCFHSWTMAQNDDPKLLREGNKSFKAKNYTEAEQLYRKGMAKNLNSSVGNYNLGASLYKQGKVDEAGQSYMNVLKDSKLDKQTAAQTFYNLGNIMLEKKKYEESIKAYKKSLNANPNDADAKYNLTYALAMLKKQQEQQKKDQDKKDQNKQNKDKQKQDEKKKQDDQKDQQNKDKQDQDKNQQQKEQQQPKISKEDAQRMLEALNNQEKNLQKKMNKKQAVLGQVEKDW